MVRKQQGVVSLTRCRWAQGVLLRIRPALLLRHPSLPLLLTVWMRVRGQLTCPDFAPNSLQAVAEQLPKREVAADSGAMALTIRGATPHPTLRGRYTIDVGQQAQRRDAVEWLLTLENTSASTQVSYRIVSAFQEDVTTWLTIGQNGGTVDAQDSHSLMLYLSRSRLGQYSAYLLVKDKQRRERDQVVRVLMEVVPDPKRTTAAATTATTTAAAAAAVLMEVVPDPKRTTAASASSSSSSSSSLPTSAAESSAAPPAPPATGSEAGLEAGLEQQAAPVAPPRPISPEAASATDDVAVSALTGANKHQQQQQQAYSPGKESSRVEGSLHNYAFEAEVPLEDLRNSSATATVTVRKHKLKRVFAVDIIQTSELTSGLLRQFEAAVRGRGAQSTATTAATAATAATDLHDEKQDGRQQQAEAELPSGDASTVSAERPGVAAGSGSVSGSCAGSGLDKLLLFSLPCSPAATTVEGEGDDLPPT